MDSSSTSTDSSLQEFSPSTDQLIACVPALVREYDLGHHLGAYHGIIFHGVSEEAPSYFVQLHRLLTQGSFETPPEHISYLSTPRLDELAAQCDTTACASLHVVLPDDLHALCDNPLPSVHSRLERLAYLPPISPPPSS